MTENKKQTVKAGAAAQPTVKIRLFKDKLITADTARAAAHDPDYVKKNTLF